MSELKAEAAHPQRQVDVLIVGAGPVGTALALDLRGRGVEALLVERLEEIPDDHPRGGNVNMRTVEHYRRWGIAERLHGLATAVKTGANAQRVPTGGRNVTFVESILGRAWGAHPFNYGRTRDEHWDIAAEPSVSVNQPKVHRLLRERALELGVEHWLGHEFESLHAHADSVEVRIKDLNSGALRSVNARFVVACDGAQSPVGKAVGILRESNNAGVSWIYAAIVQLLDTNSSELFQRLRYDFSGYLVVANPDIVSGTSPVSEDRWRFTLRGRGEEPPSEDEVLATAHALFGEDIALRLDSLTRYRRQVRIAQTYRKGRVFVAGDAAHLFPPTGGHNQNLGIGDVVNLSWKLAAVLQGWGGEALLDSYDIERRPVGWLTGLSSDGISSGWPRMENVVRADSGRALLNSDAHAAERRALSEQLYQHTFAEWNTHGVVLDVRYSDSPVVIDDGSEAEPWSETRYSASAKPGHRAPLVRLHDDSPLYDHLGSGLTLLALGAAQEQVDAFIEQARLRNIPLTVLVPGETDLATLLKHYQAPLTLIRPDQHVAWRGSAGDAGQILDTVRGQKAHQATTREVLEQRVISP
ncbi:FAD-dependent monooxygenase [Pseudomonas sp. LRF_L74]|uniref:FAD-dependent monooxygenase n=1 Tax=Pseudomonas sp. LRF_L74 TaxID=3369422 RepID=UPI003F635FA5